MTNNKQVKKVEDNRDMEQAEAQLNSIMEMVADLDSDDVDKEEEARQTIQEDALSVEVRSDWDSPGAENGNKPTEFKILLCTGGPAVQIIGKLSQYQEPESARLQYQDWFKPWTDYTLTDEQEQAVLKYCQCFYFGA